MAVRSLPYRSTSQFRQCTQLLQLEYSTNFIYLHNWWRFSLAPSFVMQIWLRSAKQRSHQAVEMADGVPQVTTITRGPAKRRVLWVFVSLVVCLVPDEVHREMFASYVVTENNYFVCPLWSFFSFRFLFLLNRRSPALKKHHSDFDLQKIAGTLKRPQIRVAGKQERVGARG